jgi:hypothetical protein
LLFLEPYLSPLLGDICMLVDDCDGDRDVALDYLVCNDGEGDGVCETAL